MSPTQQHFHIGVCCLAGHRNSANNTQQLGAYVACACSSHISLCGALPAGVIGGSISWGHGVQRGTQDWFSLLQLWMEATFPQHRFTLKNGCVPATQSSYVSSCLQQFVDADADLVGERTLHSAGLLYVCTQHCCTHPVFPQLCEQGRPSSPHAQAATKMHIRAPFSSLRVLAHAQVLVEYVTNDGYHHGSVDNSLVRSFERLLRKLLNFGRAPAVVLLEFLATDVKVSKLPFYATGVCLCVRWKREQVCVGERKRQKRLLHPAPSEPGTTVQKVSRDRCCRVAAPSLLGKVCRGCVPRLHTHCLACMLVGCLCPCVCLTHM